MTEDYPKSIYEKKSGKAAKPGRATKPKLTAPHPSLRGNKVVEVRRPGIKPGVEEENSPEVQALGEALRRVSEQQLSALLLSIDRPDSLPVRDEPPATVEEKVSPTMTEEQKSPALKDWKSWVGALASVVVILGGIFAVIVYVVSSKTEPLAKAMEQQASYLEKAIEKQGIGLEKAIEKQGIGLEKAMEQQAIYLEKAMNAQITRIDEVMALRAKAIEERLDRMGKKGR